MRNQEIYEQFGRFERDRLERQWAFELASFAERAKVAGTVLHFSGSSVGSSSSAASHRARSAEERLPEVAQSPSVVVVVFRGYFVQFI